MNTKTRHAYTPDNGIKAWKEKIMWAAKGAGIRKPVEGPVKLTLSFVLKGKNEGKPHVFRPDWDNLEKGTADSLKGLAWKDDCQVYDCRTLKTQGETEGVLITIEEII